MGMGGHRRSSSINCVADITHAVRAVPLPLFCSSVEDEEVGAPLASCAPAWRETRAGRCGPCNLVTTASCIRSRSSPCRNDTNDDGSVGAGLASPLVAS